MCGGEFEEGGFVAVAYGCHRADVAVALDLVSFSMIEATELRVSSGEDLSLRKTCGVEGVKPII